MAAGQSGVDASIRAAALKSRALRAALVGMASILVTIALGATAAGPAWVQLHLLAAFLCIAINACVFLYQFTLVREAGMLFRMAFEE